MRVVEWTRPDQRASRITRGRARGDSLELTAQQLELLHSLGLLAAGQPARIIQFPATEVPQPPRAQRDVSDMSISFASHSFGSLCLCLCLCAEFELSLRPTTILPPLPLNKLPARCEVALGGELLR